MSDEVPSAPNFFETAQQRYRKTDKCKAARQRYYDSKGKDKAKEYYQANKEKILDRSKARYQQLKNNNLKNDLSQ
jgi:hypothetical protein